MPDPQPRRPALDLFDLLGRRWALRILWELGEDPASFQDLQARCDAMSTSVLSQRLVDLREAQLVEKAQDGRYRLSEQGTSLVARLDWIDEWTRSWADALGGRRRERH